MKYRYLRALQREISLLSLGGSVYADLLPGSSGEGDYRDALRKGVESGCNYIDSAASYWGGRHEQFLGEQDFGLDVMIGSKSHLCTKQEALQAVERSRNNLRRDCIDIFYVHWPKTGLAIEPMIEALEVCRSKGWIAALGLSNFSVEQAKVAQTVGKIDIIQLSYNLLWRRHEKDLLPFCQENQIDIISYSSLAQGILSGKFPLDIQFTADDMRQNSLFFREDVWPFIHQYIAEMSEWAKDNNRSLIEVALLWLLQKGSLSSTLVSFKNMNQLVILQKIVKETLSNEELQYIEQVYSKIQHHIPDESNIFQFYP